MSETFDCILKDLPRHREAYANAKQLLLSNLVMIGELPAPTYHEAQRVNFIKDRFNESGIQQYSSDEAGNAMAILPGTEGAENILVVSHVDTIFPATSDHTVSIESDVVRGPGIADNSLGVASIVSFPELLKTAGVRLKNNLVLLAASRSLGRGNLEGIRFFLQNNAHPLKAGVCIEGVRLGRLNFASIGMIRGEIQCTVPEEYDWNRFGAAGAIVTLNEVINKITEIPLPKRPQTSVVFGSIEGGSGYSVIPTQAVLRFEVRSESAEIVDGISNQIADIASEVASRTRGNVDLDIFAQRTPGGISYDHPLAARSRSIIEGLGIEHRVGPSTSELAAMIDHDIPAVTLGLTQGENLNKPNESISIEPIFTGLAQVLGVLRAIDEGFCNEH